MDLQRSINSMRDVFDKFEINDDQIHFGLCDEDDYLCAVIETDKQQIYVKESDSCFEVNFTNYFLAFAGMYIALKINSYKAANTAELESLIQKHYKK